MADENKENLADGKCPMICSACSLIFAKAFSWPLIFSKAFFFDTPAILSTLILLYRCNFIFRNSRKSVATGWLMDSRRLSPDDKVQQAWGTPRGAGKSKNGEVVPGAVLLGPVDPPSGRDSGVKSDPTYHLFSDECCLDCVWAMLRVSSIFRFPWSNENGKLILFHVSTESYIQSSFNAWYGEMTWAQWKQLPIDRVRISRFNQHSITILFSVFLLVKGRMPKSVQHLLKQS